MRPESRGVPPSPERTRLRQYALNIVAQACAEKLRRREAVREADGLFRRAVVNAAELGCSYDQIAEVAGISRGRVGQIVQEGRQ